MSRIDPMVLRAAAEAFRRARGRAIDRMAKAIEAARAAAPSAPRTQDYWLVSERYSPLLHVELYQIERACETRVGREARRVTSWTRLALLLSRPGEHLSTEKCALGLPKELGVSEALGRQIHSRWSIGRSPWDRDTEVWIVPTQRGDLRVCGGWGRWRARLADTTRCEVREQRSRGHAAYDRLLQEAADALLGGRDLIYWSGQNGGVVEIGDAQVSAHGALRRAGVSVIEANRLIGEAWRARRLRICAPSEWHRDPHAEADPHAVRREQKLEREIVSARHAIPARGLRAAP